MKESYTYKNSKNLFNENKKLCAELQCLADIIQNDMTISYHHLCQFKRDCERLRKNIYEYESDVVRYIVLSEKHNSIENELNFFEEKINNNCGVEKPY